MAANIVKIRLPAIDYTAQLRGVTGKSTAGITLQATYNAGWDMYLFSVLVTGLYELWFDVAGGSNYSKDSIWSGSGGKIVFGEDFALSLEP